MPTITESGDGATTVFKLPVHNKTATATVNGGNVTIASQADNSVTLAAAPAAGTAVAITFSPVVASRQSPVILAQSAVASAVTGSLLETTLASILVPGGIMGPKGVLRITLLWSMTNSVNNKTLRVRLGGSQASGLVINSAASAVVSVHVRNRNETTQVLGPNLAGGFATSVGTVSTLGVNTTADQLLTITAVLAVDTETATLEGYTIEVLPA